MNASLTICYPSVAGLSVRAPLPGDLERGAPATLRSGCVSWTVPYEEAIALVGQLRLDGWAIESYPAGAMYPHHDCMPPASAVAETPDARDLVFRVQAVEDERHDQ